MAEEKICCICGLRIISGEDCATRDGDYVHIECNEDEDE